MRRALQRQVLRQCVPLATRRDHVEDCVEKLANIHLASTAALGRGIIGSQRPFALRKTARVSHTTLHHTRHQLSGGAQGPGPVQMLLQSGG